jgi:hypothetical protein
MNNEANVRRLTHSLVLEQGQGRVMSFEDIEVARAARTAKEVIKDKGKRGRKRKSAALEADEPETEADEPEPEVARMIEVSEPYNRYPAPKHVPHQKHANLFLGFIVCM